MSNIKIFSPNRFWLYFKQHVYSNYKIWLLASLVIMGVMVIYSIIFAHYPHDPRGEYMQDYFNYLWRTSTNIYYIGLLATGLILTATSFNNYSSKRAGIFYLSIPATTFEKLLSHWIITVPVFLILYHLLWIITSIIINYFAGLITGIDPGLFLPVWKKSYISASSFLTVQAFFLAGTVLTGKSSFIKTTLTFLAIYVFFIYSNKQINSFLLGDIKDSNYSLETFAFGLHSSVLHSFIYIVSMLQIPLSYIVAYYFLKEKEV